MASTRDRILDAAGQLLVSEGADRLTLAAVAKKADVSKGGLFYHFETKQVLVAAMVDRLIARFDAAVTTAGDEPGAATLAYLEGTLGPQTDDAPGKADHALAALLAGLVVDPAALVPLRAAYGRWQERIERDGSISRHREMTCIAPPVPR